MNAQDFVRFMVSQNVLQFGRFTLKSGRESPYFFNLGNIATGAALRQLGEAYAAVIEARAPEYDMLFGPAYKGIPIATATAVALARDVPVAFNRKEAKAHGEGGRFIGAPVEGRVLIVDDVLTAGTAVLEAKGMIEAAGAEVAGVVIALDRKEIVGDGQQSAVARMQNEHGVSVLSIVELEDVIEYLDAERAATEDDAGLVDDIRAYRARYCAV